jgi:hypothetical protein
MIRRLAEIFLDELDINKLAYEQRRRFSVLVKDLPDGHNAMFP